MNIKILSLVLLASLGFELKAENHMIIMGGGGEPICDAGSNSPKNRRPNCEETIFDSSMRALGKNLSQSNWNYQVNFNGGHAKTEAMLRQNFTNSAAPISNFDEKKYHQMINDYKAKILFGEIKAGDQLMVIINSHGSVKMNDQKTHLITAGVGEFTSYETLTGAKLVSLDALEELVKLSNDRGIRLGIVDLSCHSGNTMALKKNAPNTCIITSSGPMHYAYTGSASFTDKFMASLKPGSTLESAFLKARAESILPEYPMISTDENDEITAEVYNSITPFLYSSKPNEDKLSDFILSNSHDQAVCKNNYEFKNLISQIEHLQRTANGTTQGQHAAELKRLIQRYKSIQDQLINNARSLGGHLLGKSETVIVPIATTGKKKSPPRKFTYSWRELLELNIDESLNVLRKGQMKTSSPDDKAEYQASIDAYNLLKNKKQEILANYPKIKNYQEEIKKMTAQIKETQELSDSISYHEKKLYDELYRQKQSLNFNDPCRKIVL